MEVFTNILKVFQTDENIIEDSNKFGKTTKIINVTG